MTGPKDPTLANCWASTPGRSAEELRQAFAAHKLARDLQSSLDARSVEPRIELTPIGHDEDGNPILSEADWLTMAEGEIEAWEPAPDWLVQQLGMPIPVDYVRPAIRGLAATAKRAAEDGRPLTGTNAQRQQTAKDGAAAIRAAAIEEQYVGMQKSQWKAELATRFGVSTKTVHRALDGMKPPTG
ncbi:hypothetical protein [Tropicimonas sediminicola]|uniref:Uncharacterized protein n=1 Tax=Tropicimonas sediminicola TaxID=1031541 RepID=A0A239FKD9_9RHOB|nr:hypothetical protein [Tropicimonas sediminicola]SNS56773.1 hypothetical protein SAMN05421757_102692 [Tropicimonas sediminicola]